MSLTHFWLTDTKTYMYIDVGQYSFIDETEVQDDDRDARVTWI